MNESKIRPGDIVATIARPVAAMLDTLIGTSLKNCPSCARRRRRLNRWWIRHVLTNLSNHKTPSRQTIDGAEIDLFSPGVNIQLN